MTNADDISDPLSFNDDPGKDEAVHLFEEIPTQDQRGASQPRTSRFALDDDDDGTVSVSLDDDPLSDALRHSSLGFGGGDPLSGVRDPLSGDRGDPLSRGDGGAAQGSDADDAAYGTTRIDTFASYGQLVTDDYIRNGSHQYGEEEDTGDEAGKLLRRPPQQEQGMDRELHRSSCRPSADVSPASPRTNTGDAGHRTAQAGLPQRHINVCDPVKKVESSLIPGMKGGYVLYRVDTRDADRGTISSVRRRFRDFVSLADMLKVTHRGYFIPPRPEKQPNPLEAQVPDSEFVAGRCTALAAWLNQLSAHPVIGHSQELQLFLTAEGQLMGDLQWTRLHPQHSSVFEGVARLPRQLLGQDRTVPLPAEAALSTKATGDLLRRFKETTTGMKHHPPPSEAELDLMVLPDGSQARKERLEEWSAVLANASRSAEALALAFEDAGGRTGEMGMLLIKHGRFQDDAGVRPGRYTAAGAAAANTSAHLLRAGKAAVVVSRVANATCGPMTDALGPLHQALALAPAASKALREREAALLTAQALRDEADTKSAAISQLEAEGSKVFGSDKGKARKVAQLQEEVKALAAAEAAAQTEYERVKEHNLEELGRWQATRTESFARMLEGLALVQHAFYKRSANVWQAVAADLNGQGPDSSAHPSASGAGPST